MPSTKELIQRHFLGFGPSSENLQDDLALISGLEGTYLHSFLNNDKEEESVFSFILKSSRKQQQITINKSENNQQQQEDGIGFSVTFQNDHVSIEQRVVAQYFNASICEEIGEALFEVLVTENEENCDTRELLSSFEMTPFIKFFIPSSKQQQGGEQEEEEDEENRFAEAVSNYWSRLLASLIFVKKVLRKRYCEQNGRIFPWLKIIDDALFFWLDSLGDSNLNENNDSDESIMKSISLLLFSSKQNSLVFFKAIVEILQIFVQEETEKNYAKIHARQIERISVLLGRCFQILRHVFVAKSTFEFEDDIFSLLQTAVEDTIDKLLSLLSKKDDSLQSLLLLAADFGLFSKIVSQNRQNINNNNKKEEKTDQPKKNFFFTPSNQLRHAFLESILSLEEEGQNTEEQEEENPAKNKSDHFYYILKDESKNPHFLLHQQNEDENEDDDEKKTFNRKAEAISNLHQSTQKKMKILKENYSLVSSDDENEKQDNQNNVEQHQQNGNGNASLITENRIRKYLSSSSNAASTQNHQHFARIPLLTSTACFGWMILVLKKLLQQNEQQQQQQKSFAEARAMLCLICFNHAVQSINQALISVFSSVVNKNASFVLVDFVTRFVENSLQNIPLYSISCEKKQNLLFFMSSSSEGDDNNGDKNSNEQKKQQDLLETFKEKILTQKSTLGEAISISLQSLAWLSNEISQRGMNMVSNSGRKKEEKEKQKEEDSEQQQNLPRMLIQPMNNLLQHVDEHSRFKILASILILSPSDPFTTTFLAALRFCIEDDLRLLETSKTTNTEIASRRDLRSPFLDGALILQVLASTVAEWKPTWFLLSFRSESALMVLQFISWLRSVDVRLKRLLGKQQQNGSVLFDSTTSDFDRKVLRISKKEIVETIQRKVDFQRKREEEATATTGQQQQQQNNNNSSSIATLKQGGGGGDMQLMMFQFDTFLRTATLTLDGF